jgi:hypothetical protein
MAHQQPAAGTTDLDTAAGVTPLTPTQPATSAPATSVPAAPVQAAAIPATTAPATSAQPNQQSPQLMSASPQSTVLTKESPAGKELKPKLSTSNSGRKMLSLVPSPAWMKAQPYDPDNADNVAAPVNTGNSPDAWLKAQPYNPGVLTAPGQ